MVVVFSLSIAFFGILLSVVTIDVSVSFRRSEDLAKLLDYFQTQEYFVRLWRMDQVTRGHDSECYWSVEPLQIGTLENDGRPWVVKLSKEVLASDPESRRADMFEMYFFALRLAAWLDPWSGRACISHWLLRIIRRGEAGARIRLLNATFGHQLFSTLLNHQLLACRFRRADQLDSYFPTHYGFFDDAYRRLIDGLAQDLFEYGRLEKPVGDVLRAKWDAVVGQRVVISSLSAAGTGPVGVGETAAQDT